MEEDAKPPKPRSKFEPLPTSISGFNAPIASTRRDGKKPRTKTAQELVREGASARAPASLLEIDADGDSSKATAPIPQATEFVKPAGVDEPVPPAARKRGRDQGLGAGAEGKKRKKKREASS